MGTLTNNMMPPVQPTSLAIFLNFIKDSWPMIGAIIGMWKGIDAVAKYFSKKQEARLKELITTEVKPDIDRLNISIERLTKSIGALEQKIK